eukprot:TRINITY_DN38800_c0_g1_i1.p1 TRINITY_DN38800_c0_g1~~TRINITY_DN38800_c0_g1_i1.p1  ORF type:complete len:603 (-),score=75.86 TRINITY_DN38800_c0_g1_i1:48-1775(-)
MAPGFVAPGDSLAHVKGPEDVPLLSSTIYGAFQAQARRHLQRQALVVHDQNQSWTFASLLRHVDRAAQGFLDLGAERGDRIGVWLLNSGEWLIAQLATAKLGVILVNINPDYKLPELEYALNLVGCKMLIMIPTTPQSDYAKMIQELCPELSGAEKGALQCKRVPALRCVLVAGGDAMPGTIAFEHVYKDGEHTELASSCDEPVNIQFTSGTTGKPKATTLTHKGILNNAYFLGRTMRYSERDVVCVPVPLYHCFGCVMGNLSMVAFGCSLVYPAARFDPLLTLEAAATRSCTSLYGVPTMYIAMLDHPEFKKFDFTALRTGIMAGALCPVDTMNRVISEMGARDVTICYGMTETSPVSWQTRIGTSVELACSTVGQIHPHVECKVVDPETCALRRCGEPGELWTSGYCVMQGYWENAAATSESIVVDAQGARWMRTGDLAVISENGFCQIVGRIKDMILRGGENIFPREVEEPLIAHPEVSNAAVIGVPDARLGEQVCAWIAWRGGAPRYEASRHEAERRIRDYLQDRVAYFKIPKYILFRDDFPLTVTGKIRKVEMREITTRELRLQPPAAKL